MMAIVIGHHTRKKSAERTEPFHTLQNRRSPNWRRVKLESKMSLTCEPEKKCSPRPRPWRWWNVRQSLERREVAASGSAPLTTANCVSGCRRSKRRASGRGKEEEEEEREARSALPEDDEEANERSAPRGKGTPPCRRAACRRAPCPTR